MDQTVAIAFERRISSDQKRRAEDPEHQRRNRLRAAHLFGRMFIVNVEAANRDTRRNRLRAAHLFGRRIFGFVNYEVTYVAIAFERRTSSDTDMINATRDAVR